MVLKLFFIMLIYISFFVLLQQCTEPWNFCFLDVITSSREFQTGISTENVDILENAFFCLLINNPYRGIYPMYHLK